MVAKQKPLKAARDCAVLLVGFADAFRRSELVALTVEDITPHAHGIELLIRRSRTDQEGEGRTVFVPLAKSEERCPVEALQAWLELAGIGSGPIFRRINRHDGLVGDAALTGQSVALILKAAVTSSKGIDAAKIVSGRLHRGLRQPEKPPAFKLISSSKQTTVNGQHHARCAGSVEIAKCEALENQMDRETPEQKQARQQRLEDDRLKAMAEVNGKESTDLKGQ